MFERLLVASCAAVPIATRITTAVLAGTALLWSSLAGGATVEVRKGSQGISLVLIKGQMVAGDIDAFRTKTAGIQTALVALHSDGGQLIAGIEIGKIIRFKNYFTLVPAGSRCASACAIAWLGGTRRFLDGNAKIGFHAAYIVRSGQASETGVGNALLGSYLGQLGLPEQAIIYITKAAPNSMTWLDVAEANQRGIYVAKLDDKPKVASPPNTHAKPQVASAPSAPSKTQAPEAPQTPQAPPGDQAMTPQQMKMKECGAKWQEYKKANNVKGNAEYRKFLSGCLKS
jgi:hypothetical protein